MSICFPMTASGKSRLEGRTYTNNNESGIPKATAIRILKVLRDNDFFMILEEQVGSKPAVLGYQALLVITDGWEE